MTGRSTSISLLLSKVGLVHICWEAADSPAKTHGHLDSDHTSNFENRLGGLGSRLVPVEETTFDAPCVLWDVKDQTRNAFSAWRNYVVLPAEGDRDEGF